MILTSGSSGRDNVCKDIKSIFILRVIISPNLMTILPWPRVCWHPEWPVQPDIVGGTLVPGDSPKAAPLFLVTCQLWPGMYLVARSPWNWTTGHLGNLVTLGVSPAKALHLNLFLPLDWAEPCVLAFGRLFLAVQDSSITDIVCRLVPWSVGAN